MKHADLIARLEAATGPSRELDGLIGQRFGEIPSDARWMTEDVYGETQAVWVSGGYSAYKFHDPAEFTASLDSAIALAGRLFPGWRRSFFEDCDGLWIARISSPLRQLFSTDYMRERDPPGSPTPAIALLIATLKAHGASHDA